MHAYPMLHAGRGIFPTIKDFEYNEELKIEGDVTNPRPVLTLKCVPARSVGVVMPLDCYQLMDHTARLKKKTEKHGLLGGTVQCRQCSADRISNGAPGLCFSTFACTS